MAHTKDHNDDGEHTKGHGYTNQVVGGAREMFGRVTNNVSMEAEGKIQGETGKHEVDHARANEHSKGEREEQLGRMKENMGKNANDHKTEEEGRLEREKGALRKEHNQPLQH